MTPEAGWRSGHSFGPCAEAIAVHGGADAIAHDRDGRLRARARLEPIICRQIILGHAPRGEALLEARADLPRSSRSSLSTAATAPSTPSTMKPVTPSSMTSGTEPRRYAMTGVPQAIASIITSPNGSGQSIGNSSARRRRGTSPLSGSPISPMNSTSGSPQQRLDDLVEIGPVDAVDLGGDLERHARARARSRSPGRAAFPGRSARGTPDSRRCARGENGSRLARQPVVHRAPPVPARHGPPLIVRDRHQRELGERPIGGRQIGQIQPAVQRRHRARGELRETAGSADSRCGNGARRTRAARRRTRSSMIR